MMCLFHKVTKLFRFTSNAAKTEKDRLEAWLMERGAFRLFYWKHPLVMLARNHSSRNWKFAGKDKDSYHHRAF